MIKFGLRCDEGHGFEGWFGSSDDFDTQAKRGLVLCPVCDSKQVKKALQAPSVSTARRQQAIATDMESKAKAFVGAMRKMRDEVTANATDVGETFAKEARAMHYGEKPDAPIYGKASGEEVKALVEDGVPVAPLPRLPEDAN